jgi:hypothetical protein
LLFPSTAEAAENAERKNGKGVHYREHREKIGKQRTGKALILTVVRSAPAVLPLAAFLPSCCAWP